MFVHLMRNPVSGSSTERFWRSGWAALMRVFVGELGCGRMDGAEGTLRWWKRAGGGLTRRREWKLVLVQIGCGRRRGEEKRCKEEEVKEEEDFGVNLGVEVVQEEGIAKVVVG